jgi:hypothetical protein
MFQAIPHSGPFIPDEPPENRHYLPGFGLPLDFHPMSKNNYGVSSRSLLPTALDGHDMERGFIKYASLFHAPFFLVLWIQACTLSSRTKRYRHGN